MARDKRGPAVPPPEEACTYCDRCPKYDPESGVPWAKELAPLGIGPCCATTIIREEFKNNGAPLRDGVERFGLAGNFWNYAAEVFQRGPESGLGRWFINTYLRETA